MPEHLIRLRGGWLWGDREGGADTARRVSLPLEAPPRGTTRVVLTRQFGRPPLDPGRERLALRLEGVVGLVEMRLNGRAMAIPSGGATDLELSLTTSSRRGMCSSWNSSPRHARAQKRMTHDGGWSPWSSASPIPPMSRDRPGDCLATGPREA
ncbi:MAG: hypothetical protein WKF75_11860 [Singulisphaera sp.]